MFAVGFGNPSNAKKRAEELVSVSQQGEALNVLHELLTSKRGKTWQKPLEECALLYVELCVELRRGRVCKDGLIQYRQACQGANIGSLEIVIRRLLELATKRSEDAQAKLPGGGAAVAGGSGGVLAALEGDDLDAEEAAETLLAADSQQLQDTQLSDRDQARRWIKFLWDTYRNVLEVLRINSKLEHLYHEVAQVAFKFCRTHRRTSEFRRLCEMLRNHLQTLMRIAADTTQQQTGFVINPASHDSFHAHLQTRFLQLAVATELPLWQEAFRTIEDIHGLIIYAKRQPKPLLMVQYFRKLADVFFVSGNFLFHAAAWQKVMSLAITHADAPTEAMLTMGSAAVLAALCIPEEVQATGGARPSKSGGSGMYEDKYAADFEREREQRLTALLLSSPSTKIDRASIMAVIERISATSNVYADIVALYRLLERDFDPLNMCARFQPILEFIESKPMLKQYAEQMKRRITLRLLRQLARVFASVKLERLHGLVKYYNVQHLEKFVADAVRNGDVNARISHLDSSITFIEHVSGSDLIRNQLTQLSHQLCDVVAHLSPAEAAARSAATRAKLAQLAAGLPAENVALLARNAEIEARKMAREREEAAVREREAKQRAEDEKRREEEEKRRLIEENEARERDRALQVKEEAEMRLTLEKASNLEKRTGRRLGNIEEMSLEERRKAISREEQSLADEQRRTEHRINQQSVEMDYLVRAAREAERPLVVAEQAKYEETMRGRYETVKQAFLETDRKRYDADIVEKRRLERMQEDRNTFVARFANTADGAFSEAMAAWRERRDEYVAEQRAAKVERARKRAIAAAKERAAKEREAAERARKEERERREREERERQQAQQQSRAAGQPWRRDEGAAPRRDTEGAGERQPWRRDEGGAPRRDEGAGERQPWRRDEGGAPRRDEGAGERQPWRRDEGGAPRRDEGAGERQPWRRDEGGAPRRDEGAGERQPWRRDEGGAPRRDEGAGERQPWRRDEGGAPRRDEGAGERQPWRRDEGAGERQPWRRDEGGAPRRDEGAGERQPWRRDEGGAPRRDEGAGERQPWRRDEGGAPRRDEGAGERQPWRRDEGGAPRRDEGAGERQPWRRDEGGAPRRDEGAGERQPWRRDQGGAAPGAGDRQPWRRPGASGAPPAASGQGAAKPAPAPAPADDGWQQARRK